MRGEGGVAAPAVPSIGTIIENGVLFDPKNWCAGQRAPYSLTSDVSGLLAALAAREVRYLLTGDIAVLSYIAGRNTQCIELLMDPDSLAEIPGLVIEQRDRDFARCRFGALRVDVLLTSNALFAQVLARHSTEREFDEQVAPCATVEGLVLLKLYALPSLYRQGDDDRRGLYEHDIVRLIETYQPDLDAIFAELEPHLLRSDVEELRKIVSEQLAFRARRTRFGEGGA